MIPAASLAALCRFSAAAASNPSLTDIVAYWKMDEAGNVNRLDETGNGHTLVVSGTVNSGTGKINNGAVYTNNSANFLSCADAVFSGAAPFTVFAWYNPSAIGSPQTIVAHYSAAPASGWRIILGAGGIFEGEFGDGLGGNPLLSSGVSGTIGTFKLIILSMTGAGTASIRVNNGADVNGASGTIANPAVSLRVGVSVNIPSPADGVVDEIGIYNRLLTSAEKDALWNAGAGKQYPFT